MSIQKKGYGEPLDAYTAHCRWLSNGLAQSCVLARTLFSTEYYRLNLVFLCNLELSVSSLIVWRNIEYNCRAPRMIDLPRQKFRVETFHFGLIRKIEATNFRSIRDLRLHASALHLTLEFNLSNFNCECSSIQALPFHIRVCLLMLNSPAVLKWWSSICNLQI